MAAIDKIYGTIWQYNEFHKWCEENCKEALQYFYPAEWFFKSGSNISCITNLPEIIDMWLLDNCPIQWVVKAIKEQYNIGDQ